MPASWKCRLLGVLLAITAAGAAQARAGEPGDAGGDPPTLFPKGTWDLQFYGTYYQSVRAGDEKVQSGVAGAGYYFGDRHSFRVELLGYHLDNQAGPVPGVPPEDAIAAGGNIGLRYQFIEYERLTLFVEGYAGILYGHRDFPEQGTHFNFNEQFGLGATFRLRDNLHLVGGARYMHVSNARIHGLDENPTFDGVGGYVGVLLTF